MTAQVVELAAYRAQRAPTAAPSPAPLPVPQPTAAQGSAAAVEALAIMVAACRAWRDNLDRIAGGARAIVREADGLREQAQAMRAASDSVSEAGATLQATTSRTIQAALDRAAVAV